MLFGYGNHVSAMLTGVTICYAGMLPQKLADILVTTEAMVAEKPNKEEPMPASAPDMGGMGGIIYGSAACPCRR